MIQEKEQVPLLVRSRFNEGLDGVKMRAAFRSVASKPAVRQIELVGVYPLETILVICSDKRLPL